MQGKLSDLCNNGVAALKQRLSDVTNGSSTRFALSHRIMPRRYTVNNARALCSQNGTVGQGQAYLHNESPRM